MMLMIRITGLSAKSQLPKSTEVSYYLSNSRHPFLQYFNKIVIIVLILDTVLQIVIINLVNSIIFIFQSMNV